MRRIPPLSRLSFLIALLVILAIVWATLKFLPRAEAQARGAPAIVEIEGKTYMLLNEEQAARLAAMLAQQQQVIREQQERLAKGGCV